MQGLEAGLTAALLQSLRWRLDKAATASDRCQVLASYIENDLLMLRQVGPPLFPQPLGVLHACLVIRCCN